MSALCPSPALPRYRAQDRTLWTPNQRLLVTAWLLLPGPSSPRSASPQGEPRTTERLQALLLRVVRAADVGLLLPEDADWIRTQIQTTNRPAPLPNPLVRKGHST
jgi:hypothetical protein